MNSEPLVLQLSTTDPEAPTKLDAAAAALLRGPSRSPRLVVRLDGDALPPATVAMLVRVLRRLRAVGGALAVEPLSPQIRDALTLHGLDRVFAFPLDADENRGRRCRRPRSRGAAAAAVAVAVVLSLLGVLAVRVQAAVSTDPVVILGHVIERNPDLSSYQGRMHVEIRMTSFPFLRQHLDATTYYKRPSNYEIVFDHVPIYARGFEKLYTDVGDPSTWEQRFTITYQGEVSFGGHRDLVLRMVQRQRGMIDHETVFVDPGPWTIDRIRYDYYNGGQITVTQQFRLIGGYLLLAEQHAEIHIPHVRAVADGKFDGYRTNVALDDAVFARRN